MLCQLIFYYVVYPGSYHSLADIMVSVCINVEIWAKNGCQTVEQSPFNFILYFELPCATQVTHSSFFSKVFKKLQRLSGFYRGVL